MFKNNNWLIIPSFNLKLTNLAKKNSKKIKKNS